jgi:heterotetrameric sarcosine oxidase gamma subunit
MPDSATPMPLRRSALAGALRPGDHGARDYRGPGLIIAERHPLSMVQIEVRPDGVQAMLDAAADALGLRPPESFNTSVGNGLPRILWTGPNRWLVVEPESRDLVAMLRDALAPTNAAVVNLGHARVSLRLSGREVRRVLMKAGPLDWHETAFTPDKCAQTALFHVSALIDCREESTFDVYVARGYAVSFLESVEQAAAEYGYRVG